MKKIITLLLLLVVAASVIADAEPFGWQTKCVTNSPAFDVENAQVISGFATCRVVTNDNPGASLAAAGTYPGLQTSLPQHEKLRIKELARGLDYDWQKCFRFVYDNIRYVPAFGMVRGAERTLVDREGSAADQAFLLFELLKASGCDNVKIMHEPLAIDSAGQITSGFCVPLHDYGGRFRCNAASWLGVSAGADLSETYERVFNKLITAGRNVTYLVYGNIVYVVTDHFWASLTIGNVTYHLDPSLKPTVISSGRDAAADMGYQRTAFIASAGGTTTANSVQNLSADGIKNSLDAYSYNLRSAWTNANASVSQYVGNDETDTTHDGYFFHGDIVGTLPIDFLQQPDSYKNRFRAWVKLTHGTLNKNFFLDELGIRHLWLSYVTSGNASTKAALKLDDDTQASETRAVADGDASLTIEIEYAPASQSANYPLKRKNSNVYAIPVGFGGDVRGGMRSWATEEVAKLRASGISDGSLGRGWSHNYEASVTECADPDAVFGRGSLDAVIPAVVAMTVVSDMLSQQSGLTAGETARRWMIAALAVQWQMRHLVGASAAVSLGAQSLMFQRRPDGTYAPSPGVTATLVCTNGIYMLSERHGNAYAFNAGKRLASVTDRSGNVTTLAYNQAKRLTAISNSFGSSLSLTWDDDPLGNRLEQHYDDDGRVICRIDRDGSVTHCLRDGHGHVIAKQDAFGRIDVFQYDENDNLVYSSEDIDGFWREKEFVYDESNRLTETVNPLGESTSFEYDDKDRLTAKIFPDGSAIENTWSQNGLLTTVYAYDACDRLTQRNAPGATDAFAYDAVGNLLAADNAAASETFAYDAMNRLATATTTVSNHAFTTSWQYDKGGLTTNILYAAEKRKYFGYYVLASNDSMEEFKALENYRLREKSKRLSVISKTQLTDVARVFGLLMF